MLGLPTTKYFVAFEGKIRSTSIILPLQREAGHWQWLCPRRRIQIDQEIMRSLILSRQRWLHITQRYGLWTGLRSRMRLWACLLWEGVNLTKSVFNPKTALDCYFLTQHLKSYLLTKNFWYCWGWQCVQFKIENSPLQISLQLGNGSMSQVYHLRWNDWVKIPGKLSFSWERRMTWLSHTFHLLCLSPTSFLEHICRLASLSL